MYLSTVIDQCIIDCLNTYYGIEVAALTLLSLGADRNASVYKAETHDQSYFIKLKRGPDIGIDIVELLHNEGIQHIIPPVKTIQNQLTQQLDDFTLIVYPFIEGQNGFNHPLTDEQWRTLGRTLKQVHEIDVPLSLQHRIRRETYSSQWRAIVRSFYTSEPMSEKIAAFMKENAQIIQRLIERAEQLVQVIQNESPKFVLCHSDIHAGNVLMNENTIYIVDWDDPIMAPKERDLMFMGGGVGNVWNNPREEALFYEGYGKTEINKTILAYYRHERIVEDIAEYGQECLLTAEMYQHFLAMFEPNGVVDIAFNT